MTSFNRKEREKERQSRSEKSGKKFILFRLIHRAEILMLTS